MIILSINYHPVLTIRHATGCNPCSGVCLPSSPHHPPSYPPNHPPTQSPYTSQIPPRVPGNPVAEPLGIPWVIVSGIPQGTRKKIPKASLKGFPQGSPSGGFLGRLFLDSFRVDSAKILNQFWAILNILGQPGWLNGTGHDRTDPCQLRTLKSIRVVKIVSKCNDLICNPSNPMADPESMLNTWI